MKKNKFFVFEMLAMVLALGLSFVGCKSGGSSTLTINNCPKSATVMVCESATTPPATQIDFLNVFAVSNFVAVSNDRSSPFSLINMYGFAWKTTGTYMVIVTSDFDNCFKEVSFRNGSAIVDYNEMASQDSLPL
jgi:hypothetical protein